jgi:hypothetical protein
MLDYAATPLIYMAYQCNLVVGVTSGYTNSFSNIRGVSLLLHPTNNVFMDKEEEIIGRHNLEIDGPLRFTRAVTTHLSSHILLPHLLPTLPPRHRPCLIAAASCFRGHHHGSLLLPASYSAPLVSSEISTLLVVVIF